MFMVKEKREMLMRGGDVVKSVSKEEVGKEEGLWFELVEVGDVEWGYVDG